MAIRNKESLSNVCIDTWINLNSPCIIHVSVLNIQFEYTIAYENVPSTVNE